jgi:hypothetical protein
VLSGDSAELLTHLDDQYWLSAAEHTGRAESSGTDEGERRGNVARAVAWLHAFENTKNKDAIKYRIPLAFGPPPRDEWSCKRNTMTNHHTYIFNQSPQQLRRVGARGGKAQARNRRARQRAQAQLPPQTPVGIAPLVQTVAQASRVLDAQFPWLRGAEKRWAAGTRKVPGQSPSGVGVYNRRARPDFPSSGLPQGSIRGTAGSRDIQQ